MLLSERGVHGVAGLEAHHQADDGRAEEGQLRIADPHGCYEDEPTTIDHGLSSRACGDGGEQWGRGRGDALEAASGELAANLRDGREH